MPTLDSRFVGLLRCPASQSPLLEASLDELVVLGLDADRCGGWDAGLVRADGGGVYPLRKGIPVLLAEELVSLKGSPGPSGVAFSGVPVS